MIRLVLPLVALSLFAGCATNKLQNEPQYQIGLTGSRLTKTEAERAYAGGSPQIGLTAGFDSVPRVLSSQFPDYSHELQDAGVEGQVLVLFTVEIDGSVSETAVQGSPPPQLAALALDAVKRWKFAPAMSKGVPIRARVQQPFRFQTE